MPELTYNPDRLKSGKDNRTDAILADQPPTLTTSELRPKRWKLRLHKKQQDEDEKKKKKKKNKKKKQESPTPEEEDYWELGPVEARVQYEVRSAVLDAPGPEVGKVTDQAGANELVKKFTALGGQMKVLADSAKTVTKGLDQPTMQLPLKHFFVAHAV